MLPWLGLAGAGTRIEHASRSAAPQRQGTPSWVRPRSGHKWPSYMKRCEASGRAVAGLTRNIGGRIPNFMALALSLDRPARSPQHLTRSRFPDPARLGSKQLGNSTLVGQNRTSHWMDTKSILFSVENSGA